VLLVKDIQDEIKSDGKKYRALNGLDLNRFGYKFSSI